MNIKGSGLSCAICQPHYIPWIGYFEMINRVDVFVFLDDVQFIKREWKNRNKIRKSATGADTKWLTIPMEKDSHRPLIKDARISRELPWVENHSNSLKTVYKDAPFFDKYFNEIIRILNHCKQDSLANLNVNTIKYFCAQLGLTTKLILSSNIHAQGKREEKLLNICKNIGANHYLANNATGSYIEADYFLEQGIQFELQNYTHPQYEQKYKNTVLPFISHLSILDLLFNCGEESLNVIQGKGFK